MSSDAPAAFGGGVYIADTSVWARSDREPIREEWNRAVLAGQIVTCSINTLELLYSARTASEFAELEEELGALRRIPTTQSVCQAAIGALRELARRSDGYHRVSLPDALIAAAAQDAAVGVLHYDRHYDRLREVLDFDSRWVAVPGTLD